MIIASCYIHSLLYWSCLLENRITNLMDLGGQYRTEHKVLTNFVSFKPIENGIESTISQKRMVKHCLLYTSRCV